MRPCGITVLGLAAFVAAGPVQADSRGDPDRGAAVFQKCTGCHQVGASAQNGVGPHLNGVFGRTAGTLDGVSYSDGIRRAGDDGLIWTHETLDAYIADPRALVPKTRMSFGGIADPNQRADLLAYLRTFSADPSNIPEAAPTAATMDHDLDPAILALEGDADYGEYLASDCQTCHQSSGANDGIPGITGWPTDQFVIAMHAYKRKIRPHPVMQMMAGRLSAEEIAALAAYFRDLE